MSKIIDINSKKQNEDGAFYYIFLYENATYSMCMEPDSNVVKYGSATREGNQIIIDQIDLEKAESLFQATYDLFFIDVLDVGLLRLIAYFTNHLGVFAVYHDEYDENSDMLFYEVINGQSLPIEDDLKMRRIQKWFDEHFIIT